MTTSSALVRKQIAVVATMLCRSAVELFDCNRDVTQRGIRLSLRLEDRCAADVEEAGE